MSRAGEILESYITNKESLSGEFPLGTKRQQGSSYQELRMTPVDSVHFHPDQDTVDRATVDQYKQVLLDVGKVKPPSIARNRHHYEPDEMFIDDGHHRVTAARELGIKELPMWVDVANRSKGGWREEGYIEEGVSEAQEDPSASSEVVTYLKSGPGTFLTKEKCREIGRQAAAAAKQVITRASGSIQESLLLSPYVELAKKCSSSDEFIRKTNSGFLDVLYRGHSGREISNNAFMTDYYGHAAEYSDGGVVDAFAYDPEDVLYLDDARFDELRDRYSGLSDQKLKTVYQDALSGNIHAQEFSTSFPVVKKFLRSGTKYSDICGNYEKNDVFVPLLQKFAREAHNKNIIAFHGGDYSDYGGQTEYVVGDVSKLVDLRKLYLNVHVREGLAPEDGGIPDVLKVRPPNPQRNRPKGHRVGPATQGLLDQAAPLIPSVDPIGEQSRATGILRGIGSSVLGCVAGVGIRENDSDPNTVSRAREILEMVSSVLYHATSIVNLDNILEKNVFYLSPIEKKIAQVTGFDMDRRMAGEEQYYMSFSRSINGIFRKNWNVTLLIDGDRLNHRYRGLPVDYFPGCRDNTGRQPRAMMAELEDRIVSPKPEIPNAKQYIREIHCLLSHEGRPISIWRLKTILSNSGDIPVFWYIDKLSYMSLKRDKSVTIEAAVLAGRVTE